MSVSAVDCTPNVTRIEVPFDNSPNWYPDCFKICNEQCAKQCANQTTDGSSLTWMANDCGDTVFNLQMKAYCNVGSCMGFKESPDGGLEWWAILLIVIAVIAVVGGVGAAIWLRMRGRGGYATV
jgi:hypothetical protein